MARNRGIPRGQRDLTTLFQPPIARPRLLTPPRITAGVILTAVVPDDRRMYDPTRNTRRISSYGLNRHAVVPANVDRFGKAIRDLPYKLRFELPGRLAICVRRRTRREVLHALRHAGKTGMQRRKRINFWSNVSC